MGNYLGNVGYGMTFNFSKVGSPAIYETYFTYHKNIWIAVADYYYFFPFNILFIHPFHISAKRIWEGEGGKPSIRFTLQVQCNAKKFFVIILNFYK